MGDATAITLPATRPLAAAELLGFFARRAVPGVEEFADGAYRRSLALPGGPGVVEIRVSGDALTGAFSLADPGDRDAALARTRALLDLDADPAAIAAVLGADPVLGPLVAARPGLRVPGVVDPHELAIRAVLGQQVSLAGAATLAARLVTAHGAPLPDPVGGVTHLFPAAAALAGADPETLAMPRGRRRALLGLAAALAAGDVVLDPEGDRDAARAALLALPGIGPWTADYLAMRALRDPDAFLPTDLGVNHALERLGHDGRPGPAARLAEGWRPYRAYALQHLWASLAEAS